ncbi:MAG TPA: hypothetical protein VGX16_05265 [Solirubrobacteraceae bacterium]|nr:hypothetical protein [Solirubrobacteraceae bacterium]
MSRQAHVTLSGDIAGEYLVEDKRPDGRLVLVPNPDSDLSADAILARHNARPATAEEFAAFEEKHGPFLPPDGEG